MLGPIMKRPRWAWWEAVERLGVGECGCHERESGVVGIAELVSQDVEAGDVGGRRSPDSVRAVRHAASTRWAARLRAEYVSA